MCVHWRPLPPPTLVASALAKCVRRAEVWSHAVYTATSLFRDAGGRPLVEDLRQTGNLVTRLDESIGNKLGARCHHTVANVIPSNDRLLLPLFPQDPLVGPRRDDRRSIRCASERSRVFNVIYFFFFMIFLQDSLQMVSVDDSDDPLFLGFFFFFRFLSSFVCQL